jgi:hypothetical protein
MPASQPARTVQRLNLCMVRASDVAVLAGRLAARDLSFPVPRLPHPAARRASSGMSTWAFGLPRPVTGSQPRVAW